MRVVTLALLGAIGCARSNLWPPDGRTPGDIAQNHGPIIQVPHGLVFPLGSAFPAAVPLTQLRLVSTAVDPEGDDPVIFTGCTYERLGLHSADPDRVPPGAPCSTLASHSLVNLL